jgi:hypothetical protein
LAQKADIHYRLGLISRQTDWYKNQTDTVGGAHKQTVLLAQMG